MRTECFISLSLKFNDSIEDINMLCNTLSGCAVSTSELFGAEEETDVRSYLAWT